MLFPPWAPDGRAQCLHARIDLGQRHIESLGREVGKRFLVQFGEFDTCSPDGKPKGLAKREPFCDRRMIRKRQAIRQEVLDPTGAI